jgi:hypothetical protein
MPKRSLILPALMLILTLGFALSGWTAGSPAVSHTPRTLPGRAVHP